MKCDRCGKETPKDFHWKSAYYELEELVYCSTECVKKDNEAILARKHKESMIKKWETIKSALMEALDIIESHEDIEDFNEEYENIYEVIYLFDEKIKEDIK